MWGPGPQSTHPSPPPLPSAPSAGRTHAREWGGCARCPSAAPADPPCGSTSPRRHGARPHTPRVGPTEPPTGDLRGGSVPAALGVSLPKPIPGPPGASRSTLCLLKGTTRGGTAAAPPARREEGEEESAASAAHTPENTSRSRPRRTAHPKTLALGACVHDDGGAPAERARGPVVRSVRVCVGPPRLSLPPPASTGGPGGKPSLCWKRSRCGAKQSLVRSDPDLERREHLGRTHTCVPAL